MLKRGHQPDGRLPAVEFEDLHMHRTAQPDALGDAVSSPHKGGLVGVRNGEERLGRHGHGSDNPARIIVSASASRNSVEARTQTKQFLSKRQNLKNEDLAGRAGSSRCRPRLSPASDRLAIRKSKLSPGARTGTLPSVLIGNLRTKSWKFGSAAPRNLLAAATSKLEHQCQSWYAISAKVITRQCQGLARRTRVVRTEQREAFKN